MQIENFKILKIFGKIWNFEIEINRYEADRKAQEDAARRAAEEAAGKVCWD